MELGDRMTLLIFASPVCRVSQNITAHASTPVAPEGRWERRNRGLSRAKPTCLPSRWRLLKLVLLDG